jgi:NitT/TauT family transport system permease protein
VPLSWTMHRFVQTRLRLSLRANARRVRAPSPTRKPIMATPLESSASRDVPALGAQATPRAPGKPVSRVIWRCASLLACLGLWQMAAQYKVSLGFVTMANVPAPTDIAPAFWRLLHSPKLPMHLFASIVRVLVGFFAAAAVGIGFGLAIGRYRRFEDTVLPSLEVLRPIPAVAWIPLAILMFPSSEVSMMFITFIGALFPILLNTIRAWSRPRAASVREACRCSAK